MGKGIKSVLMVGVLMLILAGPAFAANYQVSWNPVDFVVCNSDPMKSGYRLYESADHGVTKTRISGAEVPTGMTTYQLKRDSLNGVCLYVTAFNQWGESKFSEPFCVQSPEVPGGLKIMLQEIVAAIEKYMLQL